VIGRSQLLRRISASTAAYALLLAFVVAVGIPVAIMADRAASRETDQWQPTLAAARALSAAVVDQEAATWAYVITSDPRFRADHDTGKAQADAALAELERLLAGDGEALARLAAVRDARAEIEAELSTLIGLVDAGDSDAAARVIKADIGAARADDFRVADQALVGLIRAREDAARADVRATERLLLGLFGALVVIAFAFGLVMRRWVSRSAAQYEAAVVEVEQREHRFRTLVDALASVVWESDADGAYTSPQEGWATYTGQPWPEHSGFGWIEMVHPDERERVRAAWARARERMHVREGEIRLWHAATASYRSCAVRSAPIIDGDRVVAWIGTITDVEDARRAQQRELEALARLRESEERHRSLVESSVALRWTTDSEGRFVEPQDEWRRYTSQSWEQHRDFGWVQALYPDDRAPVLAAWRAALESAQPYRSTGRLWHAASTTYRWFEARAVPRLADDGTVVEWAGTVTDVHERRVAERRLSAMAALTRGLATASTTDEVFATTIGVLLDHLDAPMLGIGLAEDDEFRFLRTSGLPRTVEVPDHIPLSAQSPVVDAMRTREVLSLTERERTIWYPGRTIWREAGMQSAAYVPIVGDGEAIGAIVLGFTTTHRVAPDEKAMLSTMGELVGQALSRARLFEFERSIATVLQESMLPVDPIVAGDVTIASRYVPAVTALDVGGDWYDVIPLGDRVGIAVGDVVGRGIAAAAVMGQLRSALGAAALTTDRPGEVLTILDRFARHTPGAAVTTCVYLVVDTERRTVCHSSAGHPPPLVVAPDGTGRFLTGGLGPPLAATTESSDRPDEEVAIVPGSTILLYTDGLVERRGEDLDDGFARLAAAVARNRDLPVEQLCDAVLDDMFEGGERRDDVALVVLRTTDDTARSLVRHVLTDPRNLAAVRHDLDAWLVARGVGDEDERADVVLAACEAIANAMEHAYPPTGRDLIGFEASLRDGELWMTVRDAGRWRTPRRDPTRGRGIEVMRAVMDSVDMVTSARGSTVTLRRKVTVEPAAAAEPPAAVGGPRSPAEAPS
jgi:PAS domain S-box-containing protein